MYDENEEQECLLDQKEQDGVIESIHSEYKRHRKQMNYFFSIICCLGILATSVPYFQNEASAFFFVICIQFGILLLFHFLRHKYSLYYALIPLFCVVCIYLLMEPNYPSQFFWSVQFVWCLTFVLEFGFRSYKRSIFASLSKLESLKYNFLAN
ncbi:hypothetical protein TRFO_11828 [Tritrichomonas foetus]|uniref:Uncharacterized protein n=1 Tax=Tritrichomonas foetus TaxID=1144522 RepID=A0A1J4J212_9EUKA|nr:hypothetical protein TRFO_11828 [Tritrichomonas foetus]|eukprot:OHS93410.1 hypothetical protein TRFO_11828 [Tritrichomonas foetus]